jgi:site-specific DNA recombinase
VVEVGQEDRMRAAIYCRKSTDQSEVHESEKSVAHQKERCLALIAKQGWTLAEGHVYTDDGISGAVFGEGRPALLRLMDAVKSGRRPFDIVVAYDESRLGRDVIETGYLVKQIIDRDVRLFFSDGSERRLDSATDALLMSITAFGGQFEREQASLRVRSKMHAKAKDGHSTGTVPFGYTSVAVNSHKELVIDPAQAEVVRSIFAWSAEGYGIAKIAHRLNHEQAGVRKWSGPGVRDMLTNDIYQGRIVYGKKRVTVKGGKKVKLAVPEAQWIVTERPELRIVPEALWSKVQARKATVFSTYLRTKKGRLQGRPEATISEHLLSGFCVCGTCGGRLVVWSRSLKTSTYRYLVCWKHKSGGYGACGNARSIPLEPLTDMVISHFRRDVLTPARLAKVAKDLAADADASPVRAAERRQGLEADLRKVEGRIAKLVDAVATGDAPQAILTAIKAAETQQREIQARLDQLAGAQQIVAQWSDAASQDRVEALLNDWQTALTDSPVVARQILRKLLVGSITVSEAADGDGFEYRAQGTYSRVIAGAFGGHEEAEAVTARQRGVEAAYDVQAELLALAQSKEPSQSDGTGGRTS